MDASAPPPADSPFEEFFPWPSDDEWVEEMVIEEPTVEQMRELERVWVAVPAGRRLEAVAAKAKELGVGVVSMKRHRR